MPEEDLFHADTHTHTQTDGRKDMTKIIITFRNFLKVSKTIQ